MKGKIQVLINEGLNNLLEGSVNQSALNFTEVIRLDSSFWVSYYYRGVCFKQQHRFEEAEKDFLACSRLNPKQAEPYLALGELYHFENKLAKASTLYKKAIEVNPSLVQGYYDLGHLALTKGDSKKALKYYEKCNQVNSRFPDAYLAEGILKFKEGKNENQSILLFNEAIAADSTFWRAYFWRGLAFINIKETEKCLSDWNRVIQFNRANPFFLVMRGFLYIELADFDKAFADLRRAMEAREINPEHYVGGQTLLDKQIDLQYAVRYLIRNGYGLKEESFDFLKKGFCLFLANRKSEALVALQNAEKIEVSATVFFIQALTYENLNVPDSAFHYYNKALELDTDNFDAHKKRAIYRYRLKDWKGAYADFNEMVRIDPQSAIPYRLRGNINYLLRQYNGAIIDMTRFLKTDSTDVESWKLRSDSRLLVGDNKGANEDLRKILELQPNNFDLYQRVGKNYLALGDTVNATEIFIQYSSRSNLKSYRPHLELAIIYVDSKRLEKARLEIDTVQTILGSRNDYDNQLASEILCVGGLLEFHQLAFQKAISKFTRALDKNPTNSKAKYYRAKAYQMTGRRISAMNDYKQIAGYLDASDLYQTLLKKEN